MKQEHRWMTVNLCELIRTLMILYKKNQFLHCDEADSNICFV